MQHIGFQLQENKTISMHGGFVLSSQKAPLLGLSMACVEMLEQNASALSIRKILFRNYWILSWWKIAHWKHWKRCNSCIVPTYWWVSVWMWLSLFFDNFPETQPQLVLHEWGANHAALWAGGGAGEAQLGGALPQLHGGEGDARGPPPHRGQEAAGPVEVLHGRPGDRRPGHGKPLGKLLLPGGKQKHAGVSSSGWRSWNERKNMRKVPEVEVGFRSTALQKKQRKRKNNLAGRLEGRGILT